MTASSRSAAFGIPPDRSPGDHEPGAGCGRRECPHERVEVLPGLDAAHEQARTADRRRTCGGPRRRLGWRGRERGHVDAERRHVHPVIVDADGPRAGRASWTRDGTSTPAARRSQRIETASPSIVHVRRGLGQPLIREVVHHHHDAGAAGRRRQEVRGEQHVELHRPFDARHAQSRRHRARTPEPGTAMPSR